MPFFRPITISLSPNTEPEDTRLALRLLAQPAKWRKGKCIKKLEEQFKKYLGVKYAASFNSGRSALWAILKALKIKAGDEVIIQVPTCVALAEPILWCNARPVYADCEGKTFNIDPVEVKRKITPKTKAVIVQHTFGHPAQIEKIKEITKKNDIYLIEDCAHSLGSECKGQKVGTFGEAAFFSLGRDKVISSVYGGVATTDNEGIKQGLEKIYNKIPLPSGSWTLQQLLHPVLFNYLILPTYNFFGLGKVLLVIFQKLGVLSKAVVKKEWSGGKPNYFPQRLPNALACLGLTQLKKIDRLNNHRRKIAAFYNRKLKNAFFDLPQSEKNVKNIYLRYTIKTEKASQLLLKARKQGILLGDWYHEVMMPQSTDLEKIGYKKGSCPNAESLTYRMLNLPTHININQKKAQRIVDLLKLQKNSKIP